MYLDATSRSKWVGEADYGLGERWGVVGCWGAECVTFPLYQGGAGADVEMGTHSEMSLHLYL